MATIPLKSLLLSSKKTSEILASLLTAVNEHAGITVPHVSKREAKRLLRRFANGSETDQASSLSDRLGQLLNILNHEKLRKGRAYGAAKR